MFEISATDERFLRKSWPRVPAYIGTMSVVSNVASGTSALWRLGDLPERWAFRWQSFSRRSTDASSLATPA